MTQEAIHQDYTLTDINSSSCLPCDLSVNGKCIYLPLECIEDGNYNKVWKLKGHAEQYHITIKN